MRRAVGVAVAVAAVLCASCSAVASGSSPSDSVTVVLFDVSNSTGAETVRARYDETFAIVLEHLRDAGGVLGADIVDANPLAHGGLPINETFEPCTITDNSLECREEHERQEREVLGASAEILAAESFGTDLFGGLTLAEQFFAAYPGAGERTIVLLSDMVQFADGMRFGAVESWGEAEIARLLSEAPSVGLEGVRVYVVGAGATASARMTREQIEGIERFWTRWFERSGARVVFYGANLARFPIEEVEP
jgi:hypothetical protein